MPEHSTAVQVVEQKLQQLGHTNKVVRLTDSARTAQEAADALGCQIAQIAKSIIFKGKTSARAILVIASGSNRVNEKAIAKLVDEKLGKADADFVCEQTGFVIGGVPPLGHTTPVQTFIDEDLFQFETIWAAAGHPKAVFQLTPQQLEKLTGGAVVSIH